MSLVERVRLFQMLTVENAAPRIAEKPLADAVADPIVRHMAKNSSHGEQDKDDWQIQRAILGSQGPDRKQKRIAREKRGHHQPGFGKNDQEKNGIDPGSVRIRHLAEIQIQVKE